MTATLARTPKRWPINPEVIDSPACAMPEYATYRRKFYLVTGSLVEVSGDTIEEILDEGHFWARESSRIVRVPVVPYYDAQADDPHKGRAVGIAAHHGGTLGGSCGSAIWVHDADRRYQQAFRTLRALDDSVHYMQDFASSINYDVGTLQAWWINGVSDRHPELDGFWIECRQSHRDTGLCTALDRAWDWRDYAPWTDQGHNTQLTLF